MRSIMMLPLQRRHHFSNQISMSWVNQEKTLNTKTLFRKNHLQICLIMTYLIKHISSGRQMKTRQKDSRKYGSILRGRMLSEVLINAQLKNKTNYQHKQLSWPVECVSESIKNLLVVTSLPCLRIIIVPMIKRSSYSIQTLNFSKLRSYQRRILRY